MASVLCVALSGLYLVQDLICSSLANCPATTLEDHQRDNYWTYVKGMVASDIRTFVRFLNKDVILPRNEPRFLLNKSY